MIPVFLKEGYIVLDRLNQVADTKTPIDMQTLFLVFLLLMLFVKLWVTPLTHTAIHA